LDIVKEILLILVLALFALDFFLAFCTFLLLGFIHHDALICQFLELERPFLVAVIMCSSNQYHILNPRNIDEIFCMIEFPQIESFHHLPTVDLA
jgi:hypothetical protein